MKKWLRISIFVGILLIAFFLRFYKLGEIPNGLQQDETSLGYNAYSILKTGRDEHGIFLPQNFKAFGEYKLPGYIYASVLPIAVFGLSPFSIRFISAVAGVLSIVVVFFLTESLIDLLREKHPAEGKLSIYVPYIVMLLLAINPWHLQFSRAAFEVMLANFFLLSGFLFFLIAVKTKRNIPAFLSIVSLAASLYTYNIARLFVPIFALLLVKIFWKQILLFPKKSIAFFSLILLFCLLPFIIGIFTRGGADSTFGTLIFSSAKVQAPLQEFRSYFIGQPFFLGKIFNYWSLTAWQYLNNVLAHFSVQYYFIANSDGITSTGTNGLWYMFELPLILLGSVWLWRKKTTAFYVILAWIVSLILVTSLTREPPQATRTFFLNFPVTLLSAIGFYTFITFLSRFKSKKIKYSLFLVTGLFMLISLMQYFASYYVRYPIYYAKNWRTGDRDVSLFLKSNQEKYDKIIIDQTAGFMYTTLLVDVTYSPKDFITTARWKKEDSEGFTYPEQFGKYEIRAVDWNKDLNHPKTLIITSADKKPLEVAPLQTFYYPERPVVFNIGQEIVRYPIADIAYVLVDSDNAAKFKKN